MEKHIPCIHKLNLILGATNIPVQQRKHIGMATLIGSEQHLVEGITSFSIVSHIEIAGFEGFMCA